ERLHVFTFRQLQENVFLRSGSLTVSSLLVLIAISCMSYGIAVAAVNLQNGSRHSIDYTFEEYDAESGQQIAELIKAEETKALIADWAAVSVAHMPSREMMGEDTDVILHEFDADGLREAARHLKKDLMPYAERYLYEESPYLIALSSINTLYQKKGASSLALQSDELYIYIDPQIYEGKIEQIFKQLLQYDPSVKIDGKSYQIKGVCSEDIVVDRSITIGFGIILPDQQFMEYADPDNITTYWNAYLSKERIEEKGLMQAITEGNNYFRKTGLEFENYLQNMGRQLFYIVAASYLTIYLALIFLLIANTVISLQYLMQEKKSRKRYHTLLCLGSTYEAVCDSAKRQIKWYFGVPIGIAAISSIFGVYSLFAGLLPSSLQGNGMLLVLIAAASIIVLSVIECIYMKMVMRYSSQNLLGIMKE
ncbi:MAG: ABC transporter permease, partial [Lachnospiraceae bacterium]|nr:ABC transporter permease [Lachnospiraceae bacterium]